MLLGLLEGYDLLIVLGIIALLFGSSQLPKLARSLGSASGEFKKGATQGSDQAEETKGSTKRQLTQAAPDSAAEAAAAASAAAATAAAQAESAARVAAELRVAADEARLRHAESQAG